MINNIDLIKPLLSFDNEGDFYMLYIFKRKKDQPEGEKQSSQSVRTIKTYCVASLEYLEKCWDEITHLCEYFKARAYIYVQKQNHKDVGLSMLAELALRIKNGVIVHNHIFDSVVGQLKTYEKRWIVDIDTKEYTYLLEIVNAIENCQPYSFKNNEKESKIIQTIPTKNGYHLITKRFDVQEFNKLLTPLVNVIPEIQKKNPTLLYYPNSLE